MEIKQKKKQEKKRDKASSARPDVLNLHTLSSNEGSAKTIQKNQGKPSLAVICRCTRCLNIIEQRNTNQF